MEILLSLISGLIGAFAGAWLARRSAEDQRLIDACAEFLYSADALYRATVEHYDDRFNNFGDADQDRIKRREREALYESALESFRRNCMRLRIMERSTSMTDQITAMENFLYYTSDDAYDDSVNSAMALDYYCMLGSKWNKFAEIRDNIIRQARERSMP